MSNSFSSTPLDLKLAFLERVLENDKNLFHEFERFVQENTADERHALDIKQTITDPENVIAEVANAVVKKLESLNLDELDSNDYLFPHDSYTPHYEAIEYMAELELKAVLDEFFQSSQSYMQDKRFDYAVLVMIGCYDGCVKANIKSEYALQEPLQFMIWTFDEVIKKIQDLLDIASIPRDQFYTFTLAIFRHAVLHYDDSEEFLKRFEALLMNRVQDTDDAALVRKAFSETQLSFDLVPMLHLKMVQYLDGFDRWEQESVRLSVINDTIAGNLLSLYANRGDVDKFLPLANELWNRDQCRGDVAVMFFANLGVENDPALYKQVVFHLTESYRQEQYYRALMGVANVEERKNFRGRFRYDEGFYVMMLRMEKLYDEALTFLDRDVSYRTFSKLIGEFANALPNRCFEMITDRTWQTLETERGRHVYEDVVTCLKVASNIPGYGEAMYQLVNDLYNRKPALPSLRRLLSESSLYR